MAKDRSEKNADSIKNRQSVIISLIFFVPLPPLIKTRKEKTMRTKKEEATAAPQKTLTLKTLTKSSVWDIQENDIFRLWDSADKESEVRENVRRYTDIIRSAFTIEEIKDEDIELAKKKYTKLGYKVGNIKIDKQTKITICLKFLIHS